MSIPASGQPQSPPQPLSPENELPLVGQGTGGCGCGCADEAGLPHLDATIIPHAIRHGVIFGALDSLPRGAGMVLLAPHDPIPLLHQLEGRAPGAFTLDYLQRGPDVWKLLFTRQ